MKRSEINEIMKKAINFFSEQNFFLPDFAYWTLDQWEERVSKIGMIIKNKLGWDITDYGSGNFNNIGLIHFTLRNGNPKDVKKGGIPYCEKVMIIEGGQKLPIHHHARKIEDIINRGGGTLQVELHSISEEDGLGNGIIRVNCDGIEKIINSGEIIELYPGNSVTITPDIYHCFYAKNGAEKILIGEVSSVNDDHEDNTFVNKNVQRFMRIEEDEEPLYLLYDDYEKYLNL